MMLAQIKQATDFFIQENVVRKSDPHISSIEQK